MNKIISNYKYVLLNKHNTYQYITDSVELERLQKDGTIKEGDVIIKLDEENTKVARLINFIEL